MRALNKREKWLLGLCLLTIFAVVNAFAVRAMVKALGGSGERIRELENRLADYEMWLEEAEQSAAKQKWLRIHLPRLDGSLGKAQGDLLQAMQDELFERKLEIERQNPQDIVRTEYYTEVAVRLRVEGDEKAVIEWLTTLQSPEKFQVIKALELELDRRSREEEPQAECEITIARWFLPEGSAEEAEELPASGGEESEESATELTSVEEEDGEMSDGR